MSNNLFKSIVVFISLFMIFISQNKEITAENSVSTPQKFDFGCESSPTAEGYLQISNKTIYNQSKGYGLDKETDCRDRGEPDDLRRDFTNGGAYTMKVDLANGNYFVKVISGDHIAANKTDVTIEGEPKERMQSGTDQYATPIYQTEVTDNQLNIQFGEDGRVNGVEIFSADESTPPVWPEESELRLSNITKNTVDMHWTTPEDNVAVSQYKIYSNDALLAEIDTEATQTVHGVTSYPLERPNDDLTDVTLRVEAGDASDNWSTDGPSASTKLVPESINIDGPDRISVPADDDAEQPYMADVVDQYGFQLPDEEVVWKLEGNAPDWLHITDEGILTTDHSPESPQTITLKAMAQSNQEVFLEKEITIYRPQASEITIIGQKGIAKPEQGTETFSYQANVMDQFGSIMPTASTNWEIVNDSVKGVNINQDGTLTISSSASEQMIALKASSKKNNEVFAQQNILINKKTYKYLPIEGGFAVENGEESYNRPLYGQHNSPRIIALVGDKPDSLIFRNRGNSDQEKLGHVFFGLKNGKWFGDFETITSRYVSGHQEYELRDPSIEGTILLTYVRPDDFEGLLVKVTLPDAYTDELVIASGGRDYGSYGSQNYDAMKFTPSDAAGTEVRIEQNYFAIEGGGPSLYGTSNVPLKLKRVDAAGFSEGPEALLAEEAGSQPMATGTTAGNYDNEVYFNITTGDVASDEMKDYLSKPAKVFEKSVNYYKDLSESVKMDTPNPYLNAALPAASLALDASWNNPTFQHGPINWFVPLPGWRSTYGATTAGWEDRAAAHAIAYFEKQASNGRIPSKLNGDSHYNMGEVLVDMMLYNWEWTGDLEMMANGGFDFIANHLNWMDEYMETNNEGLYESHLNAWNTDNKWNNGGGATIASVYTWRANKEMAEIAKRLEKDPTIFQQRVEKIEQAMKNKLWVADKGVFGEYKDVYGLQRVHESPDLSSIYTPIDLGFTDLFQSYQMLRFTETELENVTDSIPRDGRVPWTSNWLPNVYSSRGMYTAESANLMLTYYRLGLVEEATELQAGIDANLFTGPGPGVLSYIQREDGSQSGHVDFTDVTSMYVRTAVEGLFGIKMDVPQEQATIQPSFPREWKQASIETEYLAYDYSMSDHQETISITSGKDLEYQLKLIARGTNIKSVKVNGKNVDYRLDPGIGHTWLEINTPESNQATIEVEYNKGKSKNMPEIKAASSGAVNEPYSFSVKHGDIVRLHDPQGILEMDRAKIKKSKASVQLKDKQGAHTFFVLVESGESEMWLPVNVTLKQSMEIVDEDLVLKGGKAYAQFAIENNSSRNMNIKGTASIAGTHYGMHTHIKANEKSETVMFEIKDISMLTPGENLLTLDTKGKDRYELKTNLTSWELDQQLSGVYMNSYNIHKIDLRHYVNQDLANLHQNKYTPQPELFYWDNIPSTVTEYGLNWWQYRDGQDKVKPDLTRLDDLDDDFESDMGIPFSIPDQEENAVFTSLYDNFPDHVEIPVNVTGNKLYFFLAVATNHMQSRIENATITVNLSNGEERSLPLVNPENIDDWLSENTSSSYAQSGFIQDLGDGAHGNILSVDLGSSIKIESVEMETLSNEVMTGLLGMTVLESK
ncbi:hypothetical protein MUN88_10760 [Gracilibacillus caseinilyticus]|uniref:Beta-agarase/YXIM esterase-like galactose-binding domain-containing protein n=1 Tax=Gracilibacillus caseinilyticus TaxID=2932256 RepID=A0ABY4EQW9_9BACI|nr:hypothetical protein [Gracilibacillus caseinilyticus]UOQ46588.1 hypothetical protein MUN88_10760 [Gracilibacillus caseinilyticus]